MNKKREVILVLSDSDFASMIELSENGIAPTTHLQGLYRQLIEEM